MWCVGRAAQGWLRHPRWLLWRARRAAAEVGSVVCGGSAEEVWRYCTPPGWSCGVPPSCLLSPCCLLPPCCCRPPAMRLRLGLSVAEVLWALSPINSCSSIGAACGVRGRGGMGRGRQPACCPPACCQPADPPPPPAAAPHRRRPPPPPPLPPPPGPLGFIPWPSSSTMSPPACGRCARRGPGRRPDAGRGCAARCGAAWLSSRPLLESE